MRIITGFIPDEDGISGVEYAFLLALIAAALFAAMSTFGSMVASKIMIAVDVLRS
jgi:Flp pilus assembly pilin Flp